MCVTRKSIKIIEQFLNNKETFFCKFKRLWISAQCLSSAAVSVATKKKWKTVKEKNWDRNEENVFMRHRMWVMEHNNRNLIEYFKNMFLVYSDMFFWWFNVYGVRNGEWWNCWIIEFRSLHTNILKSCWLFTRI